MNHTQFFNFPLFEASDKPSWLTDWNSLAESLDNILEEQKELSLANAGEIATFQANLNRMSNTLSQMQTQMDVIIANETDLTGRTAVLENTLIQVDTEVKSIASRITAINDTVTTLNAQVGTNTSNITSLMGDVSGISTRVSQMSSQLTQTQERLDQARRDIINLDDKIDDTKEDLLSIDDSILRRLFKKWVGGSSAHQYLVGDIVYSPEDLANGLVKIYACQIECDGTTPLSDTQCWTIQPDSAYNALWVRFLGYVKEQNRIINALSTGFKGSPNRMNLDYNRDDKADTHYLFDVVGVNQSLYIFTSDYQSSEDLTFNQLIQAGRLLEYPRTFPYGNTTYLFDDYKRFTDMATKNFSDATIQLAFNPCSLEINNPKNMIIKPSKVIVMLPLGTISANSYVRGNKVDVQFKRKPESLGPSILHVLGTATAHLQSDNVAYDIIEIGIDVDIPTDYIVANNLLYMTIGMAIPGLTQSVFENANVTVECLTKFA